MLPSSPQTLACQATRAPNNPGSWLRGSAAPGHSACAELVDGAAAVIHDAATIGSTAACKSCRHCNELSRALRASPGSVGRGERVFAASPPQTLAHMLAVTRCGAGPGAEAGAWQHPLAPPTRLPPKPHCGACRLLCCMPPVSTCRALLLAAANARCIPGTTCA